MFFTTIVTAAPLAAVGTLALGLSTWYVSAKTTRRDKLERGWQALSDKGIVADLSAMRQTKQDELIHDPAKRKIALEALVSIDKLALLSRADKSDWELVLSPDSYAAVSEFVVHAKLLIQVVRETDMPVEVRCWNGHRRRAFRGLRRVFC